MICLLDIAAPVAPALASMTGAELYERFQRELETQAIPVVDEGGGPLGLVERNAFLVLMAAQHGYALWSKRSVTHFMNRDPVVVDGEVTLDAFFGDTLAERPAELMNGFIVTRNALYAGVGTTMVLLQASAAQAAARAETMSRLAWEAGEALAAKGRFLAVMSHEIRTPLNGVLSVAEILRRKCTQPELNPFIDTILESGGSLLRLLNDALDLSRAEAVALQLEPGPLSPRALAEEVAALWTPQAELKGLTFTVTYDGDTDLWIELDGDRLRQVLNNLVGNALKFTRAGRVTLSLRAERDDGVGVRLQGEVADTGPGVPADRGEAIFAPFAQTEEGARQGGAGLGLAVCRQIVERMGGRIALVPAIVGARFAFEIPARMVATPEAPREETGLDAAGEAFRVLIADDNATNRLVAETLCEMFGCVSTSVEDGRQALEALAQAPFDLVLMDIKMPVMDGVEATRRIRSGGGAASRIPILALTANADPGDAAFYRASGMNGVIEKPIAPDKLIAAMRDVLELDAPLVTQTG